MTLGFGMAGLEHRVLSIARSVCVRFDEITYLEIGVGRGRTLTAIAATLAHSGKAWRAIGVELPNGYDFDHNLVLKAAAQRNVMLQFNGYPYLGKATVLLEHSQEFLARWYDPIHFALIDGCHGKPCVIADFLALEPFIVEGGVVMFHDFSPHQRGTPQPHCPSGVDVQGACADLGLMSNTRGGWRFLGTITADRARHGCDMAVFEKLMLNSA